MQSDDSVVASKEELGKLLQARWTQAVLRCPDLAACTPSWEIGASEHFNKPRGFAVTRFDGSNFQLVFAHKLIGQPISRVDAIICHEIGHILDYGVQQAGEGRRELQADHNAMLLFGVTIRYDGEDVQTLDPTGITPRPERLGL